MNTDNPRPVFVSQDYYDYVRLFFAAMFELTSDVTEYADVSVIGANKEFTLRYPTSDDCEDEC